MRFLVTDTGVGIPAERQGEVFQPFSRLGKEKSSIPGTGIGLSITKRLTEAMGDRVGFTSSFGVGSKFWVEFPVVEGFLQAKAEHSVAGASANGGAGSRTILCVEDNLISLKFLEALIEGIPDTADGLGPHRRDRD